MTWDVHQTRRFARSYKKLHDNIVVELDEAVSSAAFHPDIGEKKNGDLKKQETVFFSAWERVLP